MKRSFIYGALALVLLGSCSQDEVVVENPSDESMIGFATHVDNSARAVYDVTYNNLAQFNVWAAKTRDAGTTTTLTPIMENQLVTKSSGVWTYAPLRYWIKQNAYFFNAFACNPASSSSCYTYSLPSSVGAGDFSRYYQGTLTYNNGSATNGGANGNTDLIWANKHVLTVSDANPAPEAVRFTFGHLLCKVNLKFVNDFTAEGENITIYDVKITNAATGSLDLSKISTGTPISMFQWTSGAETYDLPYRFGGSGTDLSVSFAKGATRSTEYKSMIPNQNIIVVSFKVKTKTMVDAEEYLNIVSEFNPSTIINNELGFQCGYTYTLVAHLNQKTLGNLEPIQFDVIKVDDYVQYENSGSGEYIVDLSPSETTISTYTSATANVHVSSLRAKELVYLGEFIPEDYSYEWTITPSDAPYTSLDFAASSGASSENTLVIPAGTYHSISDMSVDVVGTSSKSQNFSESYIVRLAIKDLNGTVVAEDSMTVYVYYPGCDYAGSQDGDDNDG